ncbi:MAG: hypothetical protein CM1200mP1_02860 [Candidatus Neomarinimicrobiota bacterium]|nr:MAG: hypothetical protein CM1200mP1_02860 [Candidatus Neomarinimicrobiota bacterium]
MNIMFVSVKNAQKKSVLKSNRCNKKYDLNSIFNGSYFDLSDRWIDRVLMASGLNFVINKFFPSTMPLWLAFTSILLSVLVGVYQECAILPRSSS